MNLGSGIWKKPIPDPGSRVKKASDPGTGSASPRIQTIFLKEFRRWTRSKISNARSGIHSHFKGRIRIYILYKKAHRYASMPMM
jgi:hypothetical protein